MIDVSAAVAGRDRRRQMRQGDGEPRRDPLAHRDAYIAPEFFRRIPNVGDFVVYEIGEESIVVVGSVPDEIRAYDDVCQHPGKRLFGGVSTVPKVRRSHRGWTYALDGERTNI